MTQAELSERSGINRSHLSLIESGEHRPTKDTVEAIAGALETTPEDLKWTGEYLAEMENFSDSRMYPGLRELMNDKKAMTLYKISEDEKRILRSIRLQWKNPSKQFFIDALLDYRLSRETDGE